MRIKKAGILIIAAAITCTTPAVPAMAADTSESVQEIISDNEIDSLVSVSCLFLNINIFYASSIAFPISWRIYLFAKSIHSVAA